MLRDADENALTMRVHLRGRWIAADIVQHARTKEFVLIFACDLRILLIECLIFRLVFSMFWCSGSTLGIVSTFLSQLSEQKHE